MSLMVKVMTDLTLYSYFRSTAAYRVRIALAIKEVNYRLIPVNLLKGEHKEDHYVDKNPDGLVPMLETPSIALGQSMAILEYLEETYPTPSLLPTNAEHRAYIRALAYTIASDIHPINNLRVLKYLTNTLGLSEDSKIKWYHHWLEQGFTSIEQRLQQNRNKGDYCFSDTPSLADICLVPQIYNAKRFDFSMQAYPEIMRIHENCMSLAAFESTRPENQPDVT